MTLIASYRHGNNAIYISDFRVTITNPKTNIREQRDNSFKFITLNKRMGLFTAGDVNLLQNIIPKIKSIADNVNEQSLFDNNGPFSGEIKKILENYNSSDYGICKAVGFLINPQDNSNKQFTLELHPGLGCIIK